MIRITLSRQHWKKKHLLHPCHMHLTSFQHEAATDVQKNSQISSRLILMNCSFWTDNRGITWLEKEMLVFNCFLLSFSQYKAWQGFLIAHWTLQTYWGLWGLLWEKDGLPLQGSMVIWMQYHFKPYLSLKMHSIRSEKVSSSIWHAASATWLPMVSMWKPHTQDSSQKILLEMWVNSGFICIARLVADWEREDNQQF